VLQQEVAGGDEGADAGGRGCDHAICLHAPSIRASDGDDRCRAEQPSCGFRATKHKGRR
jgi:hypothetical protein